MTLEQRIAKETAALKVRLASGVRAQREAQGLTVEAASKRVEHSPEWWRRVEAGETNLDLDSITRLAGALGTDPARLFAPAA